MLLLLHELERESAQAQAQSKRLMGERIEQRLGRAYPKRWRVLRLPRLVGRSFTLPKKANLTKRTQHHHFLSAVTVQSPPTPSDSLAHVTHWTTHSQLCTSYGLNIMAREGRAGAGGGCSPKIRSDGGRVLAEWRCTDDAMMMMADDDAGSDGDASSIKPLDDGGREKEELKGWMGR